MENPIIEWRKMEQKKVLVLTFGETFSTSDCEQAVVTCENLFQNAGNEKITMIWECLKMQRYDSPARSLWQRMLKNNKDRIGTIWLIADSLVIKAGARVISNITSYDIKNVSSFDEIKIT
ncbi:MAG: hypothetical protein ACERKD_05210 [Prolixibacteraceae bacterium]